MKPRWFLLLFLNSIQECTCGNDLYFFYRSGRTEEEVLKKASERFNVAPEKITLKQGELSSYAEVRLFLSVCRLHKNYGLTRNFVAP